MRKRKQILGTKSVLLGSKVTGKPAFSKEDLFHGRFFSAKEKRTDSKVKMTQKISCVSHGPEYYPGQKNGHYDYARNQNTVLITQYQHDQEIGKVARLAATSRIAAHRSAIKVDFSISHDRNNVLILCIIVVAVFLSRVVCTLARSRLGGVLSG